MEFLTDYCIFLLKVITIALAITIPILIIIGSSKSKTPNKGSLVVKNLSKKYENMGSTIRSSLLNPKELKKYNKLVCIILSWNISKIVINKIKRINKKINIIYT